MRQGNFIKHLTTYIFLLTSLITSATNYYWVGNSGNWNDPNHWSLTSGGQGGAGIPGENDDAIFNKQSFTENNPIVSINGYYKLHALKISSTVYYFTLNGNSSSTLEIKGDIDVNGFFKNEFAGSIKISGGKNSIHQLNFGYGLWKANIHLESKGIYNFTGPIVANNNDLYFISGQMNMNQNDIICNQFISSGNQSRKINANGSTFTVFNSWDLNPSHLTYNFSNTKIYLHNPDKNALKKYNESYNLLQASNQNNKTILNVTVNNDTVSCGNSCDGTLIATVTTDASCGGVYTIDWTPGNPFGDGTDTISNLCPGTYTANVIDCNTIFTVSVSGDVFGHAQIQLGGQLITQPSCKDSCDGSLIIQANGASYSNFTFIWSTGDTTTGSGSPVLSSVSNLCTGPVSVQISDGFGCDTTFNFFIPEPDYVKPNVVANDVLCFGECTGTANSSPTGGNGVYSYNWTPTGDTTQNVSNLCPGNYMLTVTDGNGCTGDTTITINEPLIISYDTTHQNVSCGGACDGAVGVITIAGGIGPYTHSWTTGATTSSISNLCPGVYSDTLRDQNGCDTIITFNVTEPNPLTLTMDSSNVTCFNACDGIAIAIVGGGTPPYSYSWSPVAGNNDSLMNLCPGNYVVTITDANNCTISDSINITQPLPLNANGTGIDPTCPTFCDGSASAVPTGGTTPYSYSWNPGGQTSSSINSLCAGTYTVTVTDSNNCVDVDTIILMDPPPIILTMDSVNMSCFGVCDGQATVQIAGGISPYNVVWAPGGQTTTTITGLCAGTYTVTVTDSAGCTVTDNVNVTEPTLINPNASATDATCNGICDGTASSAPMGGTPPYSYSWSPGGQTSPSISNLCAGNYTVTVTDSNGCSQNQMVTVNEPIAITTNTTGTNLNCNGVCNGSATTSPSGGTGSFTYSWSPGGQTTQTINNLCAGTYIVTITDSLGCSIQDSITITEPNPLDGNLSSVDMSCNGVCDGSITSLTIGGTPPYSYSWSPGGQTTQNLNNLCAGTYIVTITDSLGCTAQDTAVINNPPVLQANTSAIAASCGTICDGIATANPIGGTTPYSYSWSDPSNQTTQTATGLCAGTYGVTVTDSNGCSVTDSVTITNLITISVNTDSVSVSCNGACDGQATAFPSGGATPYSYSWNDPSNQTTQTATGLCPGTYFVTVTDSNGCATTVPATVPADPAVLVPNPTKTNITCNGLCDGTATAAPSGGVPPYNIVWQPGGQTTNTISNLCAGTYIVSVTDSVNCTQIDSVVIIEPDTISFNPSITNVDCNGNCNGSITINPTGGTGPISVLWMPGGQTTTTISNLCAGTYTVTATDSVGCSYVRTFVISEPPLLSSSPVSTNVTCNGNCDGTASVLVGGGTPGYSYFWSPNGETTSSISNLCPGNYSVLVTDTNGCTTSQNISISQPFVLTANASGTSIACNGSPCTGTATSNPSGGTAPYTYSWMPGGQTTQNLSNLCAGTYTVTVTDSMGCTAVDSFEVTTPTALTVTLYSTNMTCNGICDGTATANVLGGTPPYTYSWMPGGQTTSSISGLCAGTYTVTVTDSLGCFFVGSVNVTEPTLIDDNEVITNANCGFCDGVISMFPSGGTAPYTHSWDNGANSSSISNLCPGFYTDTIRDFFGCEQIFTLTISNPTGPSGVTSTVLDATCYGACDGAINVIPIGGTPGYTYSWSPGGMTDSTITGLCAGTYNLTVTDANSCVLNTSLSVSQADSITENLLTTDASCNGTCDGTASVSPSGGTAPYTYLWSTGATTSSVSGLCAGNYSVTITDNNNCSKVVNFTINSPNILNATLSVTNTLCNGSCDGQITANPLGGTAPYNYNWSNSQTTQTISGLCAGVYSVTISDSKGCSVNLSDTVKEPTLIVANPTTTDATCGVCDGTASVAPVGGTPGYTYLWSNGVTLPNTNALCAGSYTVTITDNNGCSIIETIGISNTNGPSVSTSVTPATCNGNCDGAATATASGGSGGPYTYLWSPGGQTTASVSGLCAGTYSVQVTDGSNCSTTDVITITENTQLTATITTIDASCNGVCDGSALVIPNGGVPPYTYNWSTGHTINAVAGLCAGSYTVSVSDAMGCFNTFNVVINEPNLLNASINGIDATCNGGCDGSATAVVSGGTAPFSYLWSNNATTSSITALCAGNYSVTVTDSKGCTANAYIVLGEGTAISATINTNDATCGVCDGSATATGSGGNGAPFTYNWIPLGQTTNSVNNLCPGAYTLEVADNAGCTQQFNVLINNLNGPSITADADSVTCFGDCNGSAWVIVNSGTAPFIYQWDDPNLQVNDTAINLCGGLYNIIVQDSLGCISVDSATVYEPLEILANITSTPPSCPGACDATATVNPTNGIGVLSYSWSPSGQTTQTATGLCAGMHVVTITDANNCQTIDSVLITDPNPITLTLSATSVTCNGDCDGTALVTAGGGTAPYTYAWDNGQTSSLATGLCPGTYTVTVTDSKGCTAIDSVTVPNPQLLTTTSTPTDASCNGLCDGSILTSPSGGVSPYSYIWNNGQTTQTATNLCAGTYNVIVVDQNNCTTYDTITVNEPNAISDGTTVNGPTCGVCDGSATANPSGGVGPYTYLWGNGQTTQTATGLCAGTISLDITDQGTGCTESFTIIVNSATGPATNLVTTDETCAGSCNGTATASPSGGNPPYNYTWTPGGQTSSSVNNLCSGSYTLTVTDSLNCTTVDTFTINTTTIGITINPLVDVSCNGSCDGSATAVPGSGQSPYSYVWTPTGQTTQTATGLCAGNYVVVVTDANNCKDSTTATINTPNLLTATTSVISNVTCNGSCDGSATVSVAGGSPNYSYLWSDGQTTQTATGLCAGTYTVTVTDMNNCTAIDTVVISEPNPILANEVLTLPNCGVCDGIITLNPSGGTGPYNYLWSPGGQTTASISNLCAGAYSVDITDQVGCTRTFVISLSNSIAPNIVMSSTDVLCYGDCNGSVSVTASGSIPPYTYQWSPGGYTNATVNNLCPGIYTVDVTDSLGCVAVGVDTINEPGIINSNINAQNVSCGGLCDAWAVANATGGVGNFTYLWTPTNQPVDSAINLCAGTHYVQITDSNGCAVTDSVIITQPVPLSVTIATTNVSCTSNCDGDATATVNGGMSPYNYLWTPGGQTTNSVTGLCFGSYLLSITDDNGCILDTNIALGALDTVLAFAPNDTAVCQFDSLLLTGSSQGNITSVEWFELPGMTSLGTSNSILVGLNNAGTQCYVFSAIGACTDYDTVCVTVNAAPVVDAGPNVTIFEGANTNLNGSGGGIYVWTPGSTLNDSTIANPTATPTEPGTYVYYLTVTNSSGCSATDSVIVTMLPGIKFPDGITPNGDGKNDTWVIDFIDQFPNHVVEIYNRWGELLYHSEDYKNDWDGTYNGKPLPVGTYYYVIDLHVDEIEPYTGPITILR